MPEILGFLNYLPLETGADFDEKTQCNSRIQPLKNVIKCAIIPQIT